MTKPTPEMYQAILDAPLGDDVLGDEPTVTELERLGAEMMGKEAAMFVPSGSMGNQAAILTWTHPGDAIIVEQEAHVVFYESGGPGFHSGVVTFTLPSERGVMDPEYLRSRITKSTIHTPGVKLICLENTHNRAGGTVIPIEFMREYRKIGDDNGIAIHLDGARIFNAATYLGIPAAKLAATVDSVCFCLSKGLSCPVGSILCGSEEYIAKARWHRKRMGGGMRQAGILAACGIVALNTMTTRLKEDHERAKTFGCAVNEVQGLRVDMESVQTNIVGVFSDSPAQDWVEKLGEKGVKLFATGANRMRFVFHREIDDGKLDFAIKTIASLA